MDFVEPALNSSAACAADLSTNVWLPTHSGHGTCIAKGYVWEVLQPSFFVCLVVLISTAVLPLDEKGQPKGYGFVTFTTDATAQRVIKTYANAPFGRGHVHPMRWASTNLSAEPSLGALPHAGQSHPHTPGHYPLSQTPPLLPSLQRSASDFALLDPNDHGDGHEAPPAEEPPEASLARAKELHAQAQLPAHSAEARVEMATKAAQLLAALVARLGG